MAKSFSLNTISNITNKMTFDTFNKKVDKATSSLKSTPDWNAILEICDAIRHKDVTPKYALGVIKKRLYSRSSHQIFFTLLTLESMVKNCGPAIHEEVATVAFCEILHERLQTTQDQQIRHKILDMLQTWAYAFRDLPQYRPVHDIVMYLKKTGYRFPPLNVSDAMFTTHVAPKFVDGDVCYKCNMAFSILTRRHHCRGCGQPFCQTCSTNTSILPRFGIEKPVRVCDNCYKNYGLPSLVRISNSNAKKKESVDLFFEEPAKPKKSKTTDELQEEEELQLAIALSKSEAEQKEKQRRARTQIAFYSSANIASAAPAKSSTAAAESPEMSRYLNRSYWEKRAATSKATAPVASASSSAPSTSIKGITQPPETDKAPQKETKITTPLDDPEDKEIDEFVETLQTQIEIFVNRMKSDASRGRPIVNDTAVQSLFLNLTAMHTHLIAHIRQLDDKRSYLERLQNKIIEVREYRTALDLLKAEHAAQVATAQEVAEIRRQMELAVKLEALRKSKHNYLQYQRHIAFQRVQEEERELQGRNETQKPPFMKTVHSGMYGRYVNGPVQSNSQFNSYSPPGKPEVGPPSNTLTNMSSIRTIPQNLLSQTRVQAITVNHVKGKQMPPNQSRVILPQNVTVAQDAQNAQDFRMHMTREQSILNQSSQQQINQMYQNNYNKPQLTQQINYTNLIPNHSEPGQDQNMCQYQRQQNMNDQIYMPQYSPAPQRIPSSTTQKQQPNIPINQQIQPQNINPNGHHYYTQNGHQYYAQNCQNIPSNVAHVQPNQQNLKGPNEFNNLNNGPQNQQTQNLLPPTQTPNMIQGNQNNPQTLMQAVQNNLTQQFIPTQAQNIMLSAQNNQNQTMIPMAQNNQPQIIQSAHNQQVQNGISNTQNTLPQNMTQGPQNQNVMPSAQTHQAQNLIPNTQPQNVLQATQNPPQNLVQNTQNVQGVQNQNIYKTIPSQAQNMNQNPQGLQNQNMLQSQLNQSQNIPSQGQNVQGQGHQYQNVVQGQGQALATQGPSVVQSTIQYQANGQTRLQINNNVDYQEQTDKQQPQIENRNFESQN